VSHEEIVDGAEEFGILDDVITSVTSAPLADVDRLRLVGISNELSTPATIDLVRRQLVPQKVVNDAGISWRAAAFP
jgi:hypothetical protein